MDINEVEYTSDLSQLKIRRGQLKSQLTRFQSFLNEIGSSNKTQLKLRKEKVEKIWDEFDNVQSHIEARDTSEEHINYRNAFVDLYFEIIAEANDRLAPETNNSRSGSGEHVRNDIESSSTGSNNSVIY